MPTTSAKILWIFPWSAARIKKYEARSQSWNISALWLIKFSILNYQFSIIHYPVIVAETVSPKAETEPSCIRQRSK